MMEKETEVILVSGGRRVAGANSKFEKKSPEYLEKQLSWKVAPRKGIRIQDSLTWGERKESVFYKGFLFTSEKQNMN